jgi:hypothetical protein
LQEVIEAGASRELREECGLRPEVSVETAVIGFYRDLQRAGKPEFICLSLLPVPYELLRQTRREQVFVAAIADARVSSHDVEDFLSDLDRIATDHASVIADSLCYHLNVLCRLVAERNRKVLSMIGMTPDA